MAFVDIKCLESLLIEGEDLIATEGIGSAIVNAAKRVFSMIKKLIDFVIRMISNLINKLKSKKPISVKSNESNKSEEAAADTKFDHNNNKILPDSTFATESNDVISIISPLVARIFNCYWVIYTNSASKESCEKLLEGAREYVHKASQKSTEYYNKYKSRVTIYITPKNKTSFLTELESCLSTLSNYKARIDDLTNKDFDKLADYEQGTLQGLISTISETQQIINMVHNIIVKAEVVEDKNAN